MDVKACSSFRKSSIVGCVVIFLKNKCVFLIAYIEIHRTTIFMYRVPAV